MTCSKLAVLAASILAAGVTVTAQSQNPPPRNQKPPEETSKVEAPSVTGMKPDAMGQPVDPKTYVIGAEDILRITIWRDADLSGIVGVRPDGMITRPLIGDVQAAGLTPERLTAQLREAYGATVRNPEITVEVLQVNSKHYSITGAVLRPGTFPLVVPTTVFEALTLASGFQEFAKRGDILILHAGGGKPLHFDWNKYVKGDKKARDENILLQPGDTIIVKE